MQTLSKVKTQEEILDEITLVEKAKSNPRYFSPIYEKYYNEIYGFVFKRVVNSDYAADIVSQTFLKAMSNLNKFKYRGLPFSSWLYRIATNEVNMFYRQSKRVRHVCIDSENALRLIADCNDLNRTIKEEEEARLKSLVFCINHLKENEVELLELRYFEKKSFQEIGYILDIKENAAKVRMHRIIKKLSRILGK